ncbi:MAG: acyl-CoA dehydrogenase [Alphaproteobacteria bacterium HGW-Alphaproteobacteria-5]|nr:MAG: acyl-CoA dehydrogenase [Alphaproteobacteria bacterium HGW-Alphaproteobacteria-5]
MNKQFSIPQDAPLDVRDWPTNPHVKLGDLGAEPALPDIAIQLKDMIHSFGEEVMRPVGRELDRMSAADVIAPDSPFWSSWKSYQALGINMETIGAIDPVDAPIALSVLYEELGWADAGLAISFGAGIMPWWMAAKYNNSFVLDTYKDRMIGCWGITEPDHGTDQLDVAGYTYASNGHYGRPNCTARLTDGKVIINGQKSAWVSNGTVAELCVLYCGLQGNNGEFVPSQGVCVIVPLDHPGVSRGRPLEKLGQRALPQGEIFFDQVEIDIDHLLAGPEDYLRAVYAIHTDANGLMGSIFTGTARAAYEAAYAYVHERRQGGLPIIRHQDVARRLFHMARRVELARAMSRRALQYNAQAPIPALQAAMFAKITGTQTAFDVASDAIQLLGGNGVTQEYPVEKIFRDARSSMIEDGCNEVLAIKGGMLLSDPDLLAG